MSGNLSESAFFEGVGHFRRIFDREGASPTNKCWCHKTRVIAVSCGFKMSAVPSFSFVTIHASSRQTDRQNRDSNTVRCIISQCNKRLANAKRPCDCRVLCPRLKSLRCSCAHSISDMTSFSCRDQGRDSVCPVL